MTIEANVLSTMNVFSENDVLLLDRKKFLKGISLGAMEWTVERKMTVDAFPEILNAVLIAFGRSLDSYEIWLLTGQSAWQSDTRVVRYRRLFNSLKMRGIDFESIPERFEFPVEQGGKLKYFGAVRVDPGKAAVVAKTMTPRSCSYIVLQPNGTGLKYLPDFGWTGQWEGDSELVSAIANRDGLLLQRIGFFDDARVGVVAVGNPIILKRIEQVNL